MEQIKASYGWESPAGSLLKGETAWVFEDEIPMVEPGAPTFDAIGWGSMNLNVRDSEDEVAGICVGVFPAYQRKGYRTKIREWICARAKKLGATHASIMVYKTNAAHYKRNMRESTREGSSWIYAGDVWYPEPGYGLFVRPL